MNDIANSTTGTILSFADDTSLIITSPNLIHLYERANIEISKLYDWFCANRLSLNANKTKFIVIRPPGHSVDTAGLKLMINDVALSQISNQSTEQSTKFLGIHVDECLSWSHHLKYINNKISRALFLIKQAKYFLPTDCLRTLYFAMIHPYLSYGNLTWGCAKQSFLNKTFLLQKRAVRIINKSHYNSHTEPLFKSSNILTLHDQLKYDSILFMYDFARQNLPRSFQNLFRVNSKNLNSHTTRQSNLLFIERCETSFANNLPKYSFPKIWNEWALKIPNYLDLNKTSLKKKVKSQLISNYSSLVTCKNSHCLDCKT